MPKTRTEGLAATRLGRDSHGSFAPPRRRMTTLPWTDGPRQRLGDDDLYPFDEHFTIADEQTQLVGFLGA